MRNLQKKGILQKCSGKSVKTVESFTKNEGKSNTPGAGAGPVRECKKQIDTNLKKLEPKKFYFLDSAASAASACAALSRSS